LGSHLSQIKSLLGLTAVVSLYGIASLLTVLFGSALGFGLSMQVVLVVLLLLTWPLAVLILHLRNRRKARKAEREAVGQRAATSLSSSSEGQNARPVSKVPSRVYSDLARGIEEVVQWLRKTKLSTEKTGDPVYNLPWFLVAGPAGSGKTSLLLSSSLDFHSLPSQRRADGNLVRPTRDVDWRVTDWCVFLDSSGRYQTEGPGGDEWSALIDAIIKYRKRRAIDGLVLVADAGLLLALSDAEIEQQAKLLRASLDQLNARVQTRFPVYLVFAHADSIEGFQEFFGLSEVPVNGHVWGATIPLADSASAHALFDREFGYLYDTLIRFRLQRLSENSSSAEQLRVFNFPVRFAAARRKLGLFTSSLFRPNPFSESPLLRGFYFTSNAPANQPTSIASVDTRATETVSVAGDGCFGVRLFTDVMLRDRHLAESFQSGKTNPERVRNVLIAASFACAAFILTGLFVSFFRNASLITEGSRVGRALAAHAKLTGKETEGSQRYELKDMDRLREVLVSLDEYNRAWFPFELHRFGLYQGKSLTPYLSAIYFDAVSRRFFKPMMLDTQSYLQSPPSATAQGAETSASAAKPDEDDDQSNPLESYYDVLKAYLMVSKNTDKAEASLLNEQFRSFWVKFAAGEDEPLAIQQLHYFARASAEFARGERGDEVPPPRANASDNLVTESCRALQTYRAEQRYYKRVIDEISESAKSISVAEILGSSTPLLSGTATVRGAFTIGGYRQMMKAIDAAPEEVSKDWVCPNAPTNKEKVDKTKLMAKYANQYIDAWRKFLRNIKLREYNSPEEAVSMLYELSKDDSQLAQLFKEVERQTNITRSTASFWDRVNPFSSKPAGSKEDAAANVTRAFQPVSSFVTGEGDKSGDRMKQYLNSLTQARDELEQAKAGGAEGLRRFLSDPKGGLQKFELQIKPAIGEFNKTTGGIEAAKVLVQPFDNLNSLLARENSDQIETKWVNELYDAAHQLEQRYPFADSQNEASLADLGRFFNPSDGKFWRFFNENLKSSSEFVQGKWRLKESGKSIRVTEGFMDYLNAAQQLTSALFPDGSKTAVLDFQLMVQPSAGARVEVQVNGKWMDVTGTLLPVKSSDAGGAIKVSQAFTDTPYNVFQGYWWPLRMIEKGGGTRTGDSYKLSFKVASVMANATLKPTSTTSNPLDRAMFRSMPRAPQHVR
jgi:type VI secretion system protein ImpL